MSDDLAFRRLTKVFDRLPEDRQHLLLESLTLLDEFRSIDDERNEDMPGKQGDVVETRCYGECQFTAPEVTAIRKLLSQHSSEDVRAPRPKFRRETTSLVTIRLSDELIKASKQHAKTHPALTRGNLNNLLEYLLWVELGEPKEFIIDEPD